MGHRFTLASCAVVVAMLVGVSPPAPAYAIANGEPVADGEYRFSVRLTFTGIPRPDGTRYDSACSAALIASRWVITAGHCFHDADGNRVGGPAPYPSTATIGRTDLTDTSGHVVEVVEVVQSPSTDIALGRLATAVTDVDALRLGRRAPKVGEVLRMTGWGSTGPTNPDPVTHLRTGQFTVSSLTRTTVGVTGRAPAPDTSACAYDSGAPYFRQSPSRRPVLVSIESTGPDCPHALEETTARVDTVATWIRDVIRRASGEGVEIED